MNDVVKEEIKALYKEGNEILNGFKDNTDKHVNLRRKYQIWYTKSLIVVKEVLPDRYNEFVECYTCSKRYEKNKIIIDIEAAKIVKMIFDSIEKGLSKNEIVDILNQKEIRTPMEHIKNTNEGKKWNTSMITGILNNKVYTGDLIQQK